MNYFDEAEARREVEHLHRLARNAHDEGQYATAERLLEQAVVTAQRLGDLPLQIEERFWLAAAQRMRGKHVQALATFTWLIGLASDPASSGQVTDEDSLWYLANAFMEFVACGLFLPEMPVERQLRVLADGLQWVERIGKPAWAGGFRFLRGRLLESQGDLQGARLELEVALSLARRHPDAPGYTLATYQLDLAHVLGTKTIGAYAEAKALAEEVLADAESNRNARRRAYEALAYTHLALGEPEAALDAARESLALALAMESFEGLFIAYELLGQLHRETGQLREAMVAVAQEWRWARRDGRVEYRNLALADCARVRLLQAREVCGLPARWGTLPEQLPAEANRLLASRRVQSAQRFLGWARPLAVQLDRARGSRSYQESLDELAKQSEQLAVLLAKESRS